jgi:hypothetical protein
VSKEQIERASRLGVLEYIQSHEPHTIKRVGKLYRLKEHPSLVIGENGWYWHSQGCGGTSALGYMTKVRGYSLLDAVCALLRENPAERRSTPQAKPQPKPKTLALPVRNGSNDRVIAYLRSRGINEALIQDCIRRGALYESKYYHNAVFVGRDEQGKARYAASRGVTGAFKADSDGSDKRYGFILPPDKPDSDAVAVFESPIDALSHKSMCDNGIVHAFGGWRLSLGGTSLLALTYFIKTHATVTRCFVCTDNDEAGNKAAERISEISGLSSSRLLPPNANDWNDALRDIQRLLRTQNRVQPAPDR